MEATVAGGVLNNLYLGAGGAGVSHWVQGSQGSKDRSEQTASNCLAQMWSGYSKHCHANCCFRSPNRMLSRAVAVQAIMLQQTELATPVRRYLLVSALQHRQLLHACLLRQMAVT